VITAVTAPSVQNSLISSYVFTATKGTGAATETITCNFASNSCQ
jgi:hypothetical protein